MTELGDTLIPLDQTIDGTLGIEVTGHGDDYVSGRFRVENRVRQPYGIVHGGAIMTLVESITSMATALGVTADAKLAMGQEINASFLRPITDGHVNAHARLRRRGGSAWIWEVDVTDDDGRLCCVIRATIAVRPARGKPARPGAVEAPA